MNKEYSDEWYTPKYIFDALQVEFDMHVAAPADIDALHVPTDTFLHDSFNEQWEGFVWCNPPFSGRGEGKMKWIDKMYTHGNGILLTPDRTSAPWWPIAASRCKALMFITGKVKFISPDGSIGQQPTNGTTLFAFGEKAVKALKNAENKGLGIMFMNTYPTWSKN